MLKLYFNRRSNVSELLNEKEKDESVLVFGFNGVEKINYKRELSGEESILQNIVGLSKKGNKIVITGTITDNFGILKKSVVVAEDGKLLGISDMNMCLDKTPFSPGGGHRVYQTKIGRIGILVCDDFIDFEGIKAMSLCGADIIISMLPYDEKPQDSVLIRAYSFLFGVPNVVFTNSSVIASDIKGEICGASKNEESRIIVPTKKNYRLCQIKRRGVKS